jgi:hypothetical protein
MIKEFFTDPFGLKRIAALQAEVRLLRRANHLRDEYIEDLRDETFELRKVINDMLRHETP